MKTIGIIGGGFTGTMTAVQLIDHANGPLRILLFNEKGSLNKGLAYAPYSKRHILNVTAGRMSAYPDRPDHFLDWVMQLPEFKGKDKKQIAGSFLPRGLYGEYLSEIWKEALRKAATKNISVEVHHHIANDITLSESGVFIQLNNGLKIFTSKCIIASGNKIPRNPVITDPAFYTSTNYFQDPWKLNSVEGIKKNTNVLIIGNGLTMVDTVLGLLEQGFNGEIHSLSTHGFNILPHRPDTQPYKKLADELADNMSLHDLAPLIYKHLKQAEAKGLSAEAVIDSLRPHTQAIWRSFSESDRSLFMSRFRHLWGVARHRIPQDSYETIMQLRKEGKLHIHAGKILNLRETEHGIQVSYFDKKEHAKKELNVSRVINCTGPETNISELKNDLLKNCLLKGILVQDKLKLGITTDIRTFKIIDAKGDPQEHLFTLGTTLKGELWESTAVNEIRQQAATLAHSLIHELTS